jgi:hypothetical protein
MNDDKDYIARTERLPSWFMYPSGMRILIEQKCINFIPWRIVDADFALTTYLDLREKYGRELFPIAHRDGSDDVACMEEGRGEVILVINGHTSPGEENLEKFENFWEWFRAAVDEMIELCRYR